MASTRRPPPPVVAGVAALAQALLTRGTTSTSGSRLRAAAGGAAALCLLGTAGAQFHRERTTVSPIEVDRATSLVREGPYRVTRNPMYLGLTGLLLAHAVARRSWLAVLPAAAFVVVMDRVQIPAEERALRAAFGREYEAYLRTVPRWLGPRRAVRVAGARPRRPVPPPPSGSM